MRERLALDRSVGGALAFSLLWAASLCIGCVATSTSAKTDVKSQPVVTRVVAWAVHSHDGINYLHLWSSGLPKNVLVIREDHVPAQVLETLKRELSQPVGVAVEFEAASPLVEAPPVYLESLSLSGDRHVSAH